MPTIRHTRHAVVVVATVAVAWTLGACSSDAPETTDAVASSSTAAVVIGSSSKSSPSASVVGIEEALAAAGATCQPGQRGEQECTLNGVAFTLDLDGWETDRALRAQACDQGYVNRDYAVLTDGRWVIAMDQSADYAALRAALAEQNVANVRNDKYCPS